ncbi:MAG: 3-hydroxyacyl-CoA dehydrogenase NAD-binding domain-containing protein, partial [Anderseniella sp.]
MAIKKIGVIGAGQMGSGIAHVCALSGYNVGLYDISDKAIEQGLATINGNMARQVKSGKISEDDRKKALELIKPFASLEQFGEVDLVIESAVEDEDLKRKLFSDLCPYLKPDALIGSNTSSISITRLAAGTDRPERFMGIHFMNPVPVMELVELIRGIATDEDVFQEVRTFV